MNRGVLDYLVLEVLEPISAFVKEAYNVEKKGDHLFASHEFLVPKYTPYQFRFRLPTK
jgi:hypothetical protein